MAYVDDIIALSPDHLWTFDNTLTDSEGALVGTNTSTSFSTSIAEDATNCMLTNAVGDRFALPTTTTLNNSAHDRKTIAGWFQVNSFQLPPKSIYREGADTSYLQFVMWAGNKVLFDVSNDGGVNPQAISNRVFTPNRPYHICGKFEGTSHGDFIKLYIDGIEQDVTLPADGAFGAASLNSRGVAEFGDASGATDVGQGVVILNAPTNGSYNYWASWQGANAQLTDDEIRTELFGKGALADNSISSQANLDTYADTVRGDAPLSFEITGTSLDLTADNVTFDPLCSCHIRWEGTGTLTWTNINGSDASTYVATNGGTVNIVNPATLTIECGISGYISGAEIRIYDNENTADSNYNTELDGIESNVGSTFTFSHSGVVNDIIVQVLKDGYEELYQAHTISNSDETLTLFPTVEENA